MLALTPNENKLSRRRGQKRRKQKLLRSADGMGLGMKLIELDGRRGRSIRLASEMGLANNDRTKTEAQYRQGLERCSGA